MKPVASTALPSPVGVTSVEVQRPSDGRRGKAQVRALESHARPVRLGGKLKTARGAWWNTLNPGLTTEALGRLQMVLPDLIATSPASVTSAHIPCRTEAGPWELTIPAVSHAYEVIDPMDANSWRRFGTSAHPTRYLYRFFDEAGTLLYVGICWAPARRWQQHRKTKAWWSQVHAVRLELLADEYAARAAETACIKSENPVHNIHQSVRRR